MFLSGEQIEIAWGAQRAIVASVGAALRAYSVNDRAVLDGFEADEVCPDGRGQILMPWPNRVAQGRYVFSGIRYELPIDEPALGHAIHGLVRWANWRVEHRAPDFVRLTHRFFAQPGYPFPLHLWAEYRLASTGLTVILGAKNVGAASCPFGMGAHPYFTLGDPSVDAVELCLRAGDWLPVDAHSIPGPRRPVEGTALDYRRPRPIGAAALDTAFTRLESDERGVAHVVLRSGRKEMGIWLDRTFPFVQLYTGDTLPSAARRRRGVAVEPMTCAPDAFNSGDGLRVLAPGEVLEGRWGVEPRR
jgi:aldose 1-epimerase